MSEHKRQHTRQALFHDAVLNSKMTGRVNCKIRDYCPGGMFVAWENQSVRQALVRDDEVSISFAVKLKGGKQHECQINASIAQAFDTGAGLSFVDIQPSALKILQQLAEKQAQKKAPQTINKGSANIVVALKDLIDQTTKIIIENYLSMVDETLFVAASDARTSNEQTDLFAAIKTVKARRDELKSRIKQLVSNELQYYLGKSENADSTATDIEASNLSLIEKDEFESFLSITAIVAKTEPRLKKVLFEIEKRLEYLFKTEIDAGNNPIGVAKYLNAFAHGVDNLELLQSIKQILFQAMEDGVVPMLEQLYADANKQLKEAGILPGLDYDDYQREIRSDYIKQQAEERQVQTGETHRSTANSNATMTEPASQSAPASPFTTEAPASLEGLSQQTQLLSQQLRKLQTSLQLHPEPPPGNVSTGASQTAIPQQPPEDPEKTYSSTDIAKAISLMQKEIDATWGHEVASAEMSQRLQHVLESKTLGGRHGKISHQARNAISVVNDLYDAFSDDKYISPQSRHELGQLQPSLHKLAVLDSGFLENQQHPARKVINHLAALNQTEGAEKEVISQLVQRIDSDFDQNPEVFQEILPEVEALVEDQRQTYHQNVQSVVTHVEQQNVISKQKLGNKPPVTPRKQPRELEVWIERAKQLNIGDMLAFKLGDDQQKRLALAWLGENHDPFVFVNTRGLKDSSMTLQELALQLRKGNAKVLPTDELPASDRALQQSLYKLQDRLSKQSLFDKRTELPNKKGFLPELTSATTNAQLGDKTYILYCMDFNCLKIVDRQWGEDTGAALLNKIIELLNEQLPAHAYLGCANDDKFLVLLQDYDLARAQHLAEAIICTISEFRFKWKHQSFTLKASIGIALIDRSAISAEDILAGCEEACSKAKAAGAMCVRLYDGDAQDSISNTIQINWENWLTETLQKEQAQLFKVPLQTLQEKPDEASIFILSSGTVINDEIYFPDSAFLLADKVSEQLKTLDRLVIQKAFTWLASDAMSDDENKYLLPLSPSSVTDTSLLDFLLETFTETRVPPGRIGFQIIESTAVKYEENTSILVRTMKEFGCLFYLSDFGRAGSAETEIKDLPIDFLGIDQVFINNMRNNATDQAMVKSIADIGHLLGRKICAIDVDTAVEDNQQTIRVDYIKELKIDYIITHGNAELIEQN